MKSEERDMNKQNQQLSGKGNTSPVKQKKAGGETGMDSEDACRCKEVSEKSFPGLLKVMMRDLAFWKKKNKSGS